MSWRRFGAAGGIAGVVLLLGSAVARPASLAVDALQGHAPPPAAPELAS